MTETQWHEETVNKTIIPYYGGSWVRYVKMRINTFPGMAIGICGWDQSAELFPHIGVGRVVTISDQLVSY